MLAFVGPAYLISVGYMDPGNWATDIEGGSRFGYALLWVLVLSNGMALVLQTLATRLGIVTGYDLAEGCRREYPRPVSGVLWFLAEIAIAATDLAEVLGTVLGLNLLFGLPLLWGCAVTVMDTFLLMAIQKLGVRRMEAFILMLVGTIAGCFVIEIFLAKPDWGAAAAGLRPILPDGSLYVAIGIIGATVMPHNLFLHSSLVQSRAIDRTYTGRAEACRFNLFDLMVAINGALLVNAAILIVSAADFHARGMIVTDLQIAHKLLEPMLGTHLAPLVFGIALLASGQSSTLTGTISGQVVMEGFLEMRMQPWLRRLITRCAALIPAVIVIWLAGDAGTYKLLIFSQVILSLQLPFAVIPLIHFTSQREKMGAFASSWWLKSLSIFVAIVILAANIWLVVTTLGESAATWPMWVRALAIVISTALGGLLAYMALLPIFGPRKPWDSATSTPGDTVVSQLRPPDIRYVGAALANNATDADVLSMSIELARSHHARLALIHVVETPGGMVYGELSESLHARNDRAYMEDVARQIEGPGLPVDVVVRTGKPTPVLIAVTRELGLDMLVMGAHGHTSLQNFLLGETVRGVRQAVMIPVVLVRGKVAPTTPLVPPPQQTTPPA